MIDCATIRDLLPLYVDDILSRESKSLISGHLATCENCKDAFTKLQSEFVRLPSNDGEKFDALKAIKKKLFNQKVIVAVIASVLTFAAAYGGFWFVFHRSTPMEYTDGFVQARSSPIDITLLFGKAFYSSNSISRLIDIDGTETEVTFIYVSETLSTRWWPSDRRDYAIRFGYAEEQAPLLVEIYYLIAPFGDWFPQSDEDYYAQRHNGVLLWRGTLE
ncbi:MAG: zf-HC2 domain-containing protein [Oscillospiraceae bacterium]|nr:zf-HC2 domain-containing protein [Oscillospiraceae bacterium]